MRQRCLTGCVIKILFNKVGSTEIIEQLLYLRRSEILGQQNNKIK